MVPKPKLESSHRTRSSYDRLATDYARKIYSELENKPFDRHQLDRFASLVREQGMVADLGCGPGQIARYLADRGITVFGLDLSHGMLLEAQRLNPGMAFVEGDILAVPVGSNQLGGITAFYSIIHLDRDRLSDAFVEMCRVVRPSGCVLLAFHLGVDVLHTSELWGQQG